MPLLLASLLGGLMSVAGSLVGRVLLALGITFVVYAGIDVSFDYLKSIVITNMQSTGGVIAQFLAYMWIDRAVSLILSTYTAALALKMAGGTSITKMVTK